MNEAQNTTEEIMSKNVPNVMKNYKPRGQRISTNSKHKKHKESCTKVYQNQIS